MEKILKESIVKNIILIILIIILYFPIHNYLINSGLATDKALAGDVLVAVSIIAVIACFGCFAFTYEKIKKENAHERYLGHITTGILMFVIGISLIYTGILLGFIMGYSVIINSILILLYISIIGYDMWDLLRIMD